MSAKGSGIGVGLLCLLVLGSCLSGGNDKPTPASSSSSAYIPTAPVAPVHTPTPAPAAAEAGVAVTRVIDGDTFEITGGQRVRVLGIDSCEMGTAGGAQAKGGAELWIGGQHVTLTQEPGVDLDRYGRLLRYVKDANGVDFAKTMVGYSHTGVYEGKNDASPAYVAELRALDSGGRDCGGPAPAAPATENHYVPLPNGNDEHHESRFCRRHWYC